LFQSQTDPEEIQRLYAAIVSKVEESKTKNAYLAELTGDNAQIIVDFLTRVSIYDLWLLFICPYLELRKILEGNIFIQTRQRKKVLHLLSKITKLHQVFPRCYELSESDVGCDLSKEVHGGGFGLIYKGLFQDQSVCVKAVRMYQGGASSKALRVRSQLLGQFISDCDVLSRHMLESSYSQLKYYTQILSHSMEPIFLRKQPREFAL
jgi:hypothetical protein